MRFTCSRPAAVHQRYNSVSQVLVDAGEPLNDNLKAGLFQYLAPDARLERFAKFQHSPRRFPMAVIVALDYQDTAVVADHDASDADRVLRCGYHARFLLQGRLQS